MHFECAKKRWAAAREVAQRAMVRVDDGTIALPWSAPGLGQSVTKSPLAGLVLAKCYNSSATNAIKQSRCIVTIGESTEMVGARVAAVRGGWTARRERPAFALMSCVAHY